MTASIETAGVVNALKGTLRRAGLAAEPPTRLPFWSCPGHDRGPGSHADGRPGGPGLLPVPGGPLAELLTSPDRPTEDPEPSV
jgi:hypothetical protein